MRPQIMERAVVDLLACLSTLDRRSRRLQDILADLPAVNTDLYEDPDRRALMSIRGWLETQVDRGAQVWEHRSHGDFAPWNCSWTDKGLFVFDWEESHLQTLAFGDAFYFAVSPMLHVSRNPNPALALKKALALATQISTRQPSPIADVKLHFALWVMAKRSEDPLYAAIMKHMAQEL